jgi:hypothetical protein
MISEQSQVEHPTRLTCKMLSEHLVLIFLPIRINVTLKKNLTDIFRKAISEQK